MECMLDSFVFCGGIGSSTVTYPGHLGPVLWSSNGVRDPVLFVELTGNVKQAGRAFKDGHRRAILLDVHDGRYASVGIDGLEKLRAELAGGHVHVNEVVGDSAWRISLALNLLACGSYSNIPQLLCSDGQLHWIHGGAAVDVQAWLRQLLGRE